MTEQKHLNTGSTPEARLAELGLVLPAPVAPVAAYVPVVRAGNLIWTAGQIPLVDGQLMATGLVGVDVDVDSACLCARQCVLNGLAAVRAETGSLDVIARVVRVGCFVACGAGFTGQSQVANGASELLVDIFGDAGRHARAAVGCSALPLGAPVEVEMVLAVC